MTSAKQWAVNRFVVSTAQDRFFPRGHDRPTCSSCPHSRLLICYRFSSVATFDGEKAMWLLAMNALVTARVAGSTHRSTSTFRITGITGSGDGREDAAATAHAVLLERNPSMSVPSSVEGPPGVRADLIAELVAVRSAVVGPDGVDPALSRPLSLEDDAVEMCGAIYARCGWRSRPTGKAGWPSTLMNCPTRESGSWSGPGRRPDLRRARPGGTGPAGHRRRTVG